MQTVLKFEPREDSRNIESFRREKSFWQEYALIDLDTGKVAANVRFYGSNAKVYCVAWFHDLQYYVDTGAWSVRGYGKAGGYGYHKASAAMAEALKRAGFELSEDIGGRGDCAMKRALESIAARFGIARPFIHHSHA